ncbi:MAG: hypothetical protein WAQ28_18170 [Bacteroidia bacterium]
MRKLFCIFTFVLASYVATAQTNKFDQRLLSKFTETELQEMQTKNPDALAYWNYYAGNAFQIMDLPAEKAVAHEIKGTIKIANQNSINIFELQLAPLLKDYQYYKIEGTGKLLVILSEEQIKARFTKTSK